MTDEEYKLAEEIILPIFRKVIRNDDFLAKYGINCYYAGLKADRPKWHKVADGDLPKETGEYLTNIGVLIWDYYADGRYGWHTPFCAACDCCDNVDSDEVVAWCEIPEYTEE